jgi:hypothetical protein
MRRRTFWLTVPAGTCLVLTACITTRLTREGRPVRVTARSELVANCTKLGDVVGPGTKDAGILEQDAANESALRRLRNDAGKMGANTVLLSARKTPADSAKRGEAYVCPVPPP